MLDLGPNSCLELHYGPANGLTASRSYETVGIALVPSTRTLYEIVKVRSGVPSVLRPPVDVVLIVPHLTVSTPVTCVYLAHPLSACPDANVIDPENDGSVQSTITIVMLPIKTFTFHELEEAGVEDGRLIVHVLSLGSTFTVTVLQASLPRTSSLHLVLKSTYLPRVLTEVAPVVTGTEIVDSSQLTVASLVRSNRLLAAPNVTVHLAPVLHVKLAEAGATENAHTAAATIPITELDLDATFIVLKTFQ